MVSVIDQTDDLYQGMPIPPTGVEDTAPPRHQEASRSPEPNRITMVSGGVPEEIRRLTEAGFDNYKNGKLEEAAECYRKALDLRADNEAALYSIGVISGQLKQYDESKKAFERLARLLEGLGSRVDPTPLASAHQGIGAALLGLWGATGPEEPPPELATEAEHEFRRGVELDPNYFGAWVGLGLTLHILDRLDDAEAAFRKALEIDPDSQPATERLRGVLEDKLERRLFELGYLNKTNRTIRDFTPYENRTLLKVEGKPLSEIILEERR